MPRRLVFSSVEKNWKTCPKHFFFFACKIRKYQNIVASGFYLKPFAQMKINSQQETKFHSMCICLKACKVFRFSIFCYPANIDCLTQENVIFNGGHTRFQNGFACDFPFRVLFFLVFGNRWTIAVRKNFLDSLIPLGFTSELVKQSVNSHYVCQCWLCATTSKVLTDISGSVFQFE